MHVDFCLATISAEFTLAESEHAAIQEKDRRQWLSRPATLATRRAVFKRRRGIESRYSTSNFADGQHHFSHRQPHR